MFMFTFLCFHCAIMQPFCFGHERVSVRPSLPHSCVRFLRKSLIDLDQMCTIDTTYDVLLDFRGHRSKFIVRKSHLVKLSDNICVHTA